MVAITELATMVSLLWIGGLSMILVGRAVISWLSFRYAARSALRAKEIAEATASRPSEAVSARRRGEVVPLRGRPPLPPSRSEAEA